MATETNGCSECGYAYDGQGRIPTISEMMRLPSYPAAGAARFQDVSPAFIAAVVQAARKSGATE